MAIKLPIGNTNFRDIRQKGSYYVDKTKLLVDLLDSDVTVSLITRPRRFGKSLMLSTLEEFFNICNDKEETRKIFSGLAIMEREDLVGEYMSSYPVMHFSFNGVAGASHEELINSILKTMKNWCIEHVSMFDFEKCDADDVKLFRRLKQGMACPEYDETEKGKKLLKSDMEDFLAVMIRMLNDTYGKEAIVLLDEYDVPLAKASAMKGRVKAGEETISSYEAMKQFIAGMFGPAFKDNGQFMKLALVTGCMRIAQASIFTGINNFFWFGIQDEIHEDSIGFTPQEVEKLLKAASMSERMQDFKEWYDGYLFGRAEIYCPWDVLKQVYIFQMKPNEAMKTHWLGTSGNEILKQMLRNPAMNIEEEVSGLVNGGSITATINDIVTYDILQGDKDNLWTVLYQTGYLTKVSKEANGPSLELAIPNKEVRQAFQKIIIEWMVERSDKSHAPKIIEALLSRNIDEAASLLSVHLFESMSYFNYGEDFYHAFIAAYLKIQGWNLVTDREYGTGRPDILLRNTDKTKAIIIEVKHAKKEANLAAMLKEAVSQCIREECIKGAKAEFENVACYGLACWEKKCVIKEVKENDRLPQKKQRKPRTAKKSAQS